MNLNELGNGKVNIVVAGESIEVNANEPIKETLKRILQEKGIDSFTVLVNGEEVTATNEMPETFAGQVVEVQRYVKPGC